MPSQTCCGHHVLVSYAAGPCHNSTADSRRHSRNMQGRKLLHNAFHNCRCLPLEASQHSSAPQVVARMAKSANDRHWHGAVPVLIGAVALAVMPVFMSRVAWAAFACLSIGAFGIWAVHGPLMSWPAVILSGTNAASGELLRNNITL